MATQKTKTPDTKLVKQVLWQAFAGGSQRGAIDIYAEAWCLRDVPVSEYDALIRFMLDRGLIEDYGGDLYRITRKGEDFTG